MYEEEVFKICDTGRALESSYTSSGSSDEGGRPTNQEASTNKTDSNDEIKDTSNGGGA